MSLNSTFRAALQGFYQFNVSRGGFSQGDIDSMRRQAVSLIARSLGVPKSSTPEDISRWAERLKKRKDGVLDFLTDPESLGKIEDFLSEENQEFFKRSFFQDLQEKLSKKEYEAFVNPLKRGFNLAIQNVLSSYGKYFKFAAQYQAIPELEKAAIAKKKKFSKTYTDLFSMGPKNLASYLMGQIGSPSAEVLINIRKGYRAGLYASGMEKVSKDKEGLQKILENVQGMKGSLKELVLAGSKAELSSRLQDIYNALPPDSRGRRMSVDQAFKVLNSARERINRVHELKELVEFTESSATRAFELRSANNVAALLGDMVESGREKDIRALVLNRINKKNRDKMGRDLYKISPALGRTFMAMASRGSIGNLSFLQKAYLSEKDAADVRAFQNDPNEVAYAITNRAKMDRMIAKGFDPQKFFASTAGRSALQKIRENVVIGLMGGNAATSLARKVQGSPEMKKVMEAYEKTVQSGGKENPAFLKGQIAKIIHAELAKQHGEIKDKIHALYGDVVSRSLGGSLDRLIGGTLSIYYKSSVINHVQSYVYNQKKKSLEVDISRADLSKNYVFAKGMKRLGITTLEDLEFLVSTELRDMETTGSRLTQALRMANWIRGLSGPAKMNNLDVVNFVEDMLNKYDSKIAAFVKGADPDAHMSDLEYIRKLERDRSRGKTEKKIRQYNRRRGEIDPGRRKRMEEIKLFQDTLKLAKERSPEVYRMLKMQESTLEKKGREFNRPLAEAQRAIYNTLKMMGPLTRRKKDGTFEQVPMSGKFLEDETRDLRRKFLSMVRQEAMGLVKGTFDYKQAKKFAKIQMYSERYQQLRGLFQDQFRSSDPARNTALYSQNLAERERYLQYAEGGGMKAEKSMQEMLSEGASMAGKKMESFDYLSRSAYMNIPAMVERARTVEELEEVERYVNEVIPRGFLRRVEKIEQAPGYVLRESVDQDIPEGQEMPRVRHFQEFLDIHKTRIASPDVFKSRIQERMGMLNTPGVIPVDR